MNLIELVESSVKSAVCLKRDVNSSLCRDILFSKLFGITLSTCGYSPDKSFVISGVDHNWEEGTGDGAAPADGATDLTYDGTNNCIRR